MASHVELPPPIALQQSRRWPLVVVALVTIVVFARVCSYDFSWWDDWQTIHHNPMMQQPAPVALKYYWSHFFYGLYSPITYSVWIGLAAISKLNQADASGITLNPWIYHSANLLVHVVSSLLAYLLLRMLVKKEIPACLGAILFAVHPVQVESVAWVSGMKDVLAGCLSLAALGRYIRRAQKDENHPRIIPDALGTILFVAAMLAKPSASVVPLMAMCLDRFIIGRSWRIALRASAVWIVLTIPLVIVARLAQDVTATPHAPIWARPFVVGDTFAFYLYKILCPIWLGLEYGRRPLILMHHASFYFMWLAPVGVAALIWRSRRRWLMAAGLVFCLAILPVSGLFTFEFQSYSTTADHYLYLAMIGPAIGLAFALREWPSRGVLTIVIMVLVLFGARAFVQTGVWKDDFALFRNAIEVNPDGFLSHHNLGCAYFTAGDYANALIEFEKALALNPDYKLAVENAKNAQAAIKQRDEQQKLNSPATQSTQPSGR